MASASDFTAIKDAVQTGATVSIIGVLIDYKAPRKTRGTDFSLDFTLQDDFSQSLIGYTNSLSCRLFKPQHAMPKEINVGDIVILRNFKLNAFNLRMDCVSDFRLQSAMLVFPAKSIPVPDLSQSVQSGSFQLPCHATPGSKFASVREAMAVVKLKQAASAHGQQITQHAAVNKFQAAQTKTDRLALIKDLTHSNFYDVRAQVVNLYYTADNTVELKVTDYTTNEGLFYYADPEANDPYVTPQRGFSGPYGQMTLGVILYGNNAVWARENVKNGSYIFLRNMRTKNSPANKLEAVVHDDRAFPDRVDIRELMNTADIEEIKERQRAYDRGRGSRTAFEALKPHHETSIEPTKVTMSKKAHKRQRQREANEAQQKELAVMEKEWETSRSGVNPNIRAAFPEMKLSTISDIIYNRHLDTRTPDKYNDYKLPFVNAKHRARIRVVDFYPPNIEDFAHSSADPRWRHPPEKRPGKERWEWGFALLVEDADVPRGTNPEQLRVVIGNEDGQGLLNENATNLRKKKEVLARVVERLFILWGNLHELKTDLKDRGLDLPLPPGDNRLQNKPFDCCIEEYGHEVRLDDKNPFGWQRMHRMVQTHINNT